MSKCKKMNTKLIPYIKSNLTWIIDPNAKL